MILVFGDDDQLGLELARLAARPEVALTALTYAHADIGNRPAVASALAKYRPWLVLNTAAYTNVDGGRQ